MAKILSRLFFTFFKIGAFTFGGGYAMISLIYLECVEKEAWITSDEFMEVTVIAESTPGPIAINCATYTGYKKAGLIGALISTLGIVLPSLIIIYLITHIFEDLFSHSLVLHIFKGIRVAVAILIVQAAQKMIKNILKKSDNHSFALTMIISFFLVVLVLNIFNINFSIIYLILISGIMGLSLYSHKNKKAEKNDLS